MDDEGKSYSGDSVVNDEDHTGKPLKTKKLKDFDIYKDHR
jgi:hypothetical protein